MAALHAGEVAERRPVPWSPAVVEAMAARLPAHLDNLKLRKQLCEHPFGAVTHFCGPAHFPVVALVKR